MLIMMKKYVGDKTHETTSWYLFDTSDTKDKSNAVWSEEESEKYRDVLSEDFVVPEDETYFLLAVRNFDDDTTEETLLLPITPEEALDAYPVDTSSYVESPMLTITKNNIQTGGDLEIGTTTIRPIYTPFKFMSVIAYADGMVIDAVDTTEYTYTLQNKYIPEHTQRIEIKVTHTSIYGQMSSTGYVTLNIKGKSMELTNKVVVPSLPYIPRFKTDKEFEFVSLQLIDERRITYESTSLLIPAEYLSYGKQYRLMIQCYIDGVKRREEYQIETVKQFTPYFDIDYSYGTFQESDFDILENDGDYTHLLNNKCFIPIDKDTFSIKFLNSDVDFIKSGYTLENEPDFGLPIQVSTISMFEVLFVYISTNGDKVLTKFRIDPTLYRATKVFETKVNDALSNIVYNNADDTMYTISKESDVYYVSTVSSGGSIDILSEIPDFVNTGDKTFVTSDGMYLYICGETDGIIQYEYGTEMFQTLKAYEDDVRGKDISFHTTCNNGVVMFIKSTREIYVYTKQDDTLTEFENEIEHIDKVLKLPNGSFLLKNESEQIIFK